MEPRDAVLRVLREAGAPLHWTVVQDRALRAGYLDPFQIHDVRKAVLGALADLSHDGVVRRSAKGVYQMVADG